MELTKTTRADSFLLGTSTSMTERKQFSSLKKNLILEDDHQIIEEPIIRETTKISAEEYNDYVE